MLNKSLKFLVVASTALAVSTASAMAQGDPTITFPSGSALFPDGSEGESLYVTSLGIWNKGVTAGGFGAVSVSPTVTGAVGLFWCTDVKDTLTLTSNYNQDTFTTSNPGAGYPTNPPSSTQAAQITNILYNEEANGANTYGLGNTSGETRSIMSAATQLAIWAVLYDTSTTGYDITNSSQNFHVGSQSMYTDPYYAILGANALLSCVATGSYCPTGWGSTPGTYGASNFIPVTLHGSQSLGLLVTTSGSQGQGVPEPSTLDLLLAALLGLTPFLRLGWRKRG